MASSAPGRTEAASSATSWKVHGEKTDDSRKRLWYRYQEPAYPDRVLVCSQQTLLETVNHVSKCTISEQLHCVEENTLGETG